MAVTLVVTVTTPKSMQPLRNMVKEEARRWRLLMMMMMVVVGHDDGDKQQSTKQFESGVDIDSGCGNKNPVAHRT